MKTSVSPAFNLGSALARVELRLEFLGERDRAVVRPLLERKGAANKKKFMARKGVR